VDYKEYKKTMAYDTIDFNSMSWFAVEKYAQAKMLEYRERLESPFCKEATAHLLRGQILAMKELLELKDG